MFLVFLLTLFTLTFSKRRHIATVKGYTAHGPNTYMGELIADYSGRILNKLFRGVPDFIEIAAQDTVNGGSTVIDENTDPSLLVTTTSRANDVVGQPPYNPDHVNIPINDIGVLKLFSFNLFDRVVLKPWEEGTKPGIIHAKRESSMADGVTVGEWNRGSGKLTIEQEDDGIYLLTLEICGIKGGVYHVLDFGATNTKVPGERGVIGETGAENFYSVPAGGLPSMLVTDEYGYGKRKWYQKWNPLLYCGFNQTCSLDYGVIYHFDASIYGASSGLEKYGYGGGIVYAVHVLFPTGGIPFKDPPTEFIDEKCGYDDMSDSSSDSDSSSSSGSSSKSSSSYSSWGWP